MPRADYQGADPLHPVDVPMAKNARDSVKNAAVNSSTTYGVNGASENFGVNEAANVSAAERLDRDGYDTGGLNIRTGRSKSTRFTGRK